ncbi:hypothetical protein ACFWAY_39175 [Rhodococcus sp. NPDC059968]|uniref:hypothetical protein n=1 Tax=Rhodococcus sp. NPDC059968 TaxID=3347017 RepID=UPI00366C8264
MTRGTEYRQMSTLPPGVDRTRRLTWFALASSILAMFSASFWAVTNVLALGGKVGGGVGVGALIATAALGVIAGIAGLLGSRSPTPQYVSSRRYGVPNSIS